MGEAGSTYRTWHIAASGVFGIFAYCLYSEVMVGSDDKDQYIYTHELIVQLDWVTRPTLLGRGTQYGVGSVCSCMPFLPPVIGLGHMSALVLMPASVSSPLLTGGVAWWWQSLFALTPWQGQTIYVHAIKQDLVYSLAHAYSHDKSQAR